MKDSLFFELHELGNVVDLQSDRALQEGLGIGFSQFKILLAARGRSGLAQRELAAYLGQTEASVSRQLKLMRGQGLLKVRAEPKNRRRHSVVITEKGLSVMNEAVDLLQTTHASVFGSLSYKEQQLMKTLVDRLLGKARNKSN